MGFEEPRSQGTAGSYGAKSDAVFGTNWKVIQGRIANITPLVF
jgi:hypothetical protein